MTRLLTKLLLLMLSAMVAMPGNADIELACLLYTSPSPRD